jgi:predicted NAD/FAD-dependent oxidoreductase
VVAQKLIDVAQSWLGSKVVSYQVHGWKFSQPNTSYGKPYAVIKEPGTLILAGDAFSPQRNIEGAVLSGLAAAEYIIQKG